MAKNSQYQAYKQRTHYTHVLTEWSRVERICGPGKCFSCSDPVFRFFITGAFGDLSTNASFLGKSDHSSRNLPFRFLSRQFYSQLKSLADVMHTFAVPVKSRTAPVSLVRVSKSGDSFSELNTSISIRISSSSDLDAVNAASLKELLEAGSLVGRLRCSTLLFRRYKRFSE